MVDVRLFLESIGILDGSDNIADGSLTNAFKNPGSSTSNIPSFGTFTQVDANRPSLVQLEVRVETDGTNPGQIAVDIDEDGDSAADDTLDEFAPATLAAGEGNNFNSLIYVPAGGQYQVRNVADPNTANSIEVANEIVG